MWTLQTSGLSFVARVSREPSVARASRFATGIAAAVLLLVLPAIVRADWDALGGSLNAINTPESLDYTQEMTSVSGTPWVAWVEPSGPPPNATRLRVASWNGTSWVQRGSDLNVDPALSALAPSIANVGEVPYVAWVQQVSGGADPQDLRVARWNAATSAWDLVGGPLEFGGPDAFGNLPMIRDIGGEPHVLFVNVGSIAAPGTLEVKRWNGTAWVSVGNAVASSVGGDLVDRSSIAGAGGDVYAAWTKQQSIGGFVRNVLHVARLDGTDWVDAGSPAHAGATDGYLASLADIDGDLGIAWLEVAANGKFELRVAVLDGNWIDVGAAVDDDVAFGLSGGPSLLEIDGTPHVAWGQDLPVGDLRVAQFAGGAWSLVGSPQRRDLTAAAGQPSLADLDGFPAVAWRELTSLIPVIGANTYEVHVSRIAPPPLETIIIGNATATNAGVGSFAFTAVPPAGATFECSYDDEPFVPCTSPHQSDVLDPGNHNFRVRASNANGTDPTPASRDFIVDRDAPTTTIRLDGSRTPLGAFAGSVTVDADVTDPPLSSGPRSKFCLVDPLTPPTSFGNFGSQPCGVVVTAIGTHTAYAIANDEAGNASAIVSVTFSIVPAPDTTITDGPSGVVYSVPSFRFASNVAGARFECRIDGGPYTSCSSAILAYKVYGLSQGAHNFEVRAIGPDGLVDPSPASRTFTLGTQALDGGCSFRLTFRNLEDDRVRTGCAAKRAICPLGSVCTRVGEVNVGNEDIGISYTGVVGAAEFEFIPRGSTTKPFGVNYGCSTPSSIFTRGPCPATWTSTVIGKGQSIAVVCSSYFLGNYSSPLAEPFPGPDEARGILCDGTITIRPATALETAPTGTGTGVGIVVPGPGILGVAPLAVARSAAAGSAAPKPPFKTISSKVKGEGVKELKLNLGPAEKKTLRTERRLELTLDITFTPTDGESVSRTETVVLTTRCKPTKKRPFC